MSYRIVRASRIRKPSILSNLQRHEKLRRKHREEVLRLRKQEQEQNFLKRSRVREKVDLQRNPIDILEETILWEKEPSIETFENCTEIYANDGKLSEIKKIIEYLNEIDMPVSSKILGHLLWAASYVGGLEVGKRTLGNILNNYEVTRQWISMYPLFVARGVLKRGEIEGLIEFIQNYHLEHDQGNLSRIYETNVADRFGKGKISMDELFDSVKIQKYFGEKLPLTSLVDTTLYAIGKHGFYTSYRDVFLRYIETEEFQQIHKKSPRTELIDIYLMNKADSLLEKSFIVDELIEASDIVQNRANVSIPLTSLIDEILQNAKWLEEPSLSKHFAEMLTRYIESDEFQQINKKSPRPELIDMYLMNKAEALLEKNFIMDKLIEASETVQKRANVSMPLTSLIDEILQNAKWLEEPRLSKHFAEMLTRYIESDEFQQIHKKSPRPELIDLYLMNKAEALLEKNFIMDKLIEASEIVQKRANISRPLTFLMDGIFKNVKWSEDLDLNDMFADMLVQYVESDEFRRINEKSPHPELIDIYLMIKAYALLEKGFTMNKLIEASKDVQKRTNISRPLTFLMDGIFKNVKWSEDLDLNDMFADMLVQYVESDEFRRINEKSPHPELIDIYLMVKADALLKKGFTMNKLIEASKDVQKRTNISRPLTFLMDGIFMNVKWLEDLDLNDMFADMLVQYVESDEFRRINEKSPHPELIDIYLMVKADALLEKGFTMNKLIEASKDVQKRTNISRPLTFLMDGIFMNVKWLEDLDLNDMFADMLVQYVESDEFRRINEKSPRPELIDMYLMIKADALLEKSFIVDELIEASKVVQKRTNISRPLTFLMDGIFKNVKWLENLDRNMFADMLMQYVESDEFRRINEKSPRPDIIKKYNAEIERRNWLWAKEAQIDRLAKIYSNI